jgi:hypothetical protein
MARRQGARYIEFKFSLNDCASVFVLAIIMSARPGASVVLG